MEILIKLDSNAIYNVITMPNYMTRVYCKVVNYSCSIVFYVCTRELRSLLK